MLEVHDQGVSRVGSFWGMQKKIRAMFSYSFWGSLAIFSIPLSLSSHGALPVCICVQISPFYKDTVLIGLELTLHQCDLNLLLKELYFQV